MIRLRYKSLNFCFHLYEKFHGEIKLVIERRGGIDKRLERVERKIDLLTETTGQKKKVSEETFSELAFGSRAYGSGNELIK